MNGLTSNEPTYNELILKRINAVMANQATPEVSVYEDAFACIRNISHDRDEALPVSEMGELKRKIMTARRALSTDGKNSEAQRLYELLLRCWCYESPHLFESYLFYTEHKRPFAKQFFLPRYRQLKGIVNGLQDLADDKLELLAISMPPGSGKALANDTPVLTRSGWKKHGDLIVGDEVIGLDGNFKKVLYVHPKCMLDVEIEFTNAEKIVCHENHVWMVHDRARQKDRLMETHQLENRRLDYGGEAGHRGHRYVFMLPKNKPVVGEQKQLPMDPYTFGVWLGNGANKNPTICSSEKDLCVIERVRQNIGEPSWSTIHKTTGVHYYGFGFRKKLQELGFCHSRKTVQKYIPECYITASFDQRLQLLAGLLDTDGTLNGNKYIFSTSEPKLRDTFVDLVSTFGWRCYIHEAFQEKSSSGVKFNRPNYAIGFSPDLAIPCVVPRKQNNGLSENRRIAIKCITRIEPMEGNCITVEGDGMYLVGKTLIPTHNSTLALFFLTWLAGRNPEKPILTGSHANSFLSGAYSECLRMMDPEGEYCWHDCFPELKVISTNAKDMLIDIGRDKRDAKRFTTLEFSSIGSGNAGKVRAENLLYCDDLVSSLEESMSADRMEKLWQAYTVDLRQRKIGNCNELHIATRWSVRDVIGRLDALYGDDPRARFIVKPALNENDESNFDYPIEAGFTTEFYHQQRAMMDDASWKALYMNQPIEREGLLYQEDELRRYFELPDGEPDAIISVCDTKDRGQDYCVMPVAYVYGNDYYIEDVLCDNSAPDVVEPRLAEICLRNRIQMSRFESNSAGGKVAEKIQQLIKERNGITRITTKYTTAQKETKIIINSPWIQEHCLFKDDSVIRNNKEYKRFLQFLTTYTLMGKNKHDDVPDAMAMLAEYAQSFGSTQATVFRRPF